MYRFNWDLDIILFNFDCLLKKRLQSNFISIILLITRLSDLIYFFRQKFYLLVVDSSKVL